MLAQPGDSGPDMLSELRMRLADGPDDEEYVIESQAPAKSAAANATTSMPGGKPAANDGRPVYAARARLKRRSGAELSSDLMGDGEVRGGTRVHVLETQRLADGTERSCLALEGHEDVFGWVSTYLSGEANLVEVGEGSASHMASLAAAVKAIGGANAAVPVAAAAPAAPKLTKKKLPSFGGGGEKCQACGKTAYVAERVQVGKYYFHSDCLKCAECNQRLGSEYGIAANGDGVDCLFCTTHEQQARQRYPQPSDTSSESAATAAPVAPSTVQPSTAQPSTPPLQTPLQTPPPPPPEPAALAAPASESPAAQGPAVAAAPPVPAAVAPMAAPSVGASAQVGAQVAEPAPGPSPPAPPPSPPPKLEAVATADDGMKSVADAANGGGAAPADAVSRGVVEEEGFFSSVFNALLPLIGSSATHGPPPPATAGGVGALGNLALLTDSPRETSVASRLAHARQQRSLERGAGVKALASSQAAGSVAAPPVPIR